MLHKVLLVLVIVILGSIAAHQLIKALTPLIPILIILGLCLFAGGGYIRKQRNRW